MERNHTKKKITIGLILILLLGVFLVWGLQDKKDPFWTELDEWMRTDFHTLDKKVSELHTLYEDFQHHPVDNDSLAFQLVATPFLPSVEFSKFKSYFDLALSAATLSSETGFGSLLNPFMISPTDLGFSS